MTTTRLIHYEKNLLISYFNRFYILYSDLGLAEHLDFILTSEECKAEKPQRQIFEMALERAKCSNPSAAYHIGTSLDTDVSEGSRIY